MKNTFHLIAEKKKADLGFQIGGFVIMLILFFQIGPFAMFFEALVQVISCCLWITTLKDTPQLTSGKRIRKFMMILFVILCISAFIPGWNFIVCLLMLFAGPVIGMSYFIITLKEIIYYRDARKPYYLL